MAYSFDDAKAAERHKTQYFEMLQSPSGKPTSGLPVNRFNLSRTALLRLALNPPKWFRKQCCVYLPARR